jgi:hypothetical protein
LFCTVHCERRGSWGRLTTIHSAVGFDDRALSDSMIVRTSKTFGRISAPRKTEAAETSLAAWPAEQGANHTGTDLVARERVGPRRPAWTNGRGTPCHQAGNGVTIGRRQTGSSSRWGLNYSRGVHQDSLITCPLFAAQDPSAIRIAGFDASTASFAGTARVMNRSSARSLRARSGTRDRGARPHDVRSRGPILLSSDAARDSPTNLATADRWVDVHGCSAIRWC